MFGSSTILDIVCLSRNLLLCLQIFLLRTAACSLRTATDRQTDIFNENYNIDEGRDLAEITNEKFKEVF